MAWILNDTFFVIILFIYLFILFIILVIIQRNASTNLEKIYTSPYKSFNFQQLFFYDIFCATRILLVIGRQSIVYYL